MVSACCNEVPVNVQVEHQPGSPTLHLNSNSLAPVIELLTELLSQQRELVAIQQAHLQLVSASTEACNKAGEPAVDSTGHDNKTVARESASRQHEMPILQTPDPMQGQQPTQILEVAEWQAELHSEIIASQQLPEGVPVTCYGILHLIGVLPHAGTALARCLRNCFIWVCTLCGFAFSTIKCLTAENSVRMLAGILGMSVSVAVVLPGWFIWTNQFTKHGATLSLLQRMVQRQFQWQSLERDSRIFWVAVPAICVFVFVEETIMNLMLYRHEYGVAQFLDSKLFLFFGDALARHLTNLIITMGTLAFVMVIFFVFGQIWMAHLASHLHRHNIRLYAGAVDRALQGDLDTEQVVSALSNIELSVSTDLLRASNTWVRFSLYQMLVYACVMLVAITLFLRGIADVGQRHTLPVHILMIFNLALIQVSLALPLAMVKSIFQVDIQLALNNPSVMHRAQKYFTSQFLPHLNFLGWGFRFAGDTLGSGTFVRIGSSIFIALCIAVSNIALTLLSATS